MDRTHKHLDFFISHNNATLAYLKNKNLTNVQLLTVGLLERLRHTSAHLKLVLDNIYLDKYLEFSAGLSIRAVILDMMIGLTLLRKLQEAEVKGANESEFNKIAEDYSLHALSDGFEVFLNYLDNALSYGFYKPLHLKRIYSHLHKRYASFFELPSSIENKPKLKYEKFDTPNLLFKGLAKSEDFKEISKIYEVYSYYSKYDHFGALYFEIINVDFPRKMESLSTSVLLFVKHQTNLYHILGHYMPKDKFIKHQSDIAVEYGSKH